MAKARLGPSPRKRSAALQNSHRANRLAFVQDEAHGPGFELVSELSPDSPAAMT
jgi:hypothetical protein